MRNEIIQELAEIWGKSHEETEKIVDKMKLEINKPSTEQITYERKLDADKIVEAYFNGKNLKEALKEVKKCK